MPERDRTLAIERIAAPPFARFDADWVARGWPVLLTGVADSWHALSRWTSEYLKARCGERSVTALFDEQADHGTVHRRVYCAARRTSWRRALDGVAPGAGVRTAMRFGDLLDRLTAEPPDRRYVLGAYPLDAVSSDLHADLDTARYINGGRVQAKLMIGRDSFTPLHYHASVEAFLTLIRGHKRVTLFPSAQTSLLHPYPWYTPIFTMAQVDDRRPDLAAHPRFARAKPIVVDMAPGDMLYIPVHWFHSVQSEGFALGVSWFWTARLRSWRFPVPGLPILANHIAPLTLGAQVRRACRRVAHRVIGAPSRSGAPAHSQ